MFWRLRLLAYGRRVVRAVESGSLALTVIADLLQRDWDERHAATKPKPTEFGTFDRTAAEKSWREDRVARGESVDEDEL